ncbi:NifU family protein [Streptomyces sp. LP05-1]|uniref:NifU family protein n=1 Tax=Streptomyces pyxinae TaxID=2970734 RepID=A0ABT2CPY3_9ACTN|nr:NifU family protein [Streptomyces sp. LP05-1]MCS0639506.1 NifU family protein [Streptomyces sp. LP05-1]
MAAQSREQRIGEHVAELLGALDEAAGAEARDTAEELVRSLVDFYGAGIERAVRLLGDAPREADPVRVLADDELVGGLLVLHDLHPDDTLTRVRRALDEVRPYLGSHAGDVDITGLEGETLSLALRGSCDGCPSSAQTVRWTIEEAVARLAPEIATVEVDGVPEQGPSPDREPQLLQIMSGPPGEGHPVTAGGPGDAGATAVTGATEEEAEWHELAAPAPVRDGETALRDVAGVPVLLIRLPGGLYAYRDHCPACGARLGAGRLEQADGTALLRCPGCPAAYDVRHAGRGVAGGHGDPGAPAHLEPVPLLEKDHVVRVALPRARVPAGARP